MIAIPIAAAIAKPHQLHQPHHQTAAASSLALSA